MDSQQSETLGVPDYLVVVGMLLCSVGIGLFQAHKAKKKGQGTEGYLLGNRSMSFWPVAISLAVNFKSAVTVIGIPADVYQFGIVFAWHMLAVLLTGPIVGFVLIPILYNLKICSAYEYLEKRFGRPIRMIATSGFLLQTVLYMGVNIYAPALALARGYCILAPNHFWGCYNLLLYLVTGFPQITAMLTTGFVCVTYTTLGGLRGVVWSDVFQAAVMFTAMLSFIIQGTSFAGGAKEVWNYAIKGGRNNLVSFDFDLRIRNTFWVLVFGTLPHYIGIFGTNQTNVQRYFCVNSVKHARRAVCIGTIAYTVMSFLAVACGVVLYALFHACDPIESGCIAKRDELMPYAVMQIFQAVPGMRGLFLAGVYSASLSTVSSGLNAMVSVIVADFLQPYTSWSDSRYAVISRVLTPCLGVIIIGTGFLISYMGNILSVAMGIVGSFSGTYLALFLMGVWMPFVNSWGAGAGFLTGLLGAFLTFIGSKSFEKPSYLTRKLPISTAFCTSECGFTGSINATLAPQYSTPFEVFNITHGSYSVSTLEQHEMTFLQNYLSMSYLALGAIGFLYALAIGITVSLVSGGCEFWIYGFAEFLLIVHLSRIARRRVEKQTPGG